MLPTCRRHGMGVIPWSPLGGGWLSGKWRKGADAPESTRAQRLPARYDLSDPANQRKLDAADALGKLADEAGMTLIQLALAFVINHPAVTAAIIGPRTMEQLESQLGADEVVLDPALLDRIDEIVPPGTNINPVDAGWQNPALTARGAPALAQPARARPQGERRVVLGDEVRAGGDDLPHRGEEAVADLLGQHHDRHVALQDRPAGRPRRACARP